MNFTKAFTTSKSSQPVGLGSSLGLQGDTVNSHRVLNEKDLSHKVLHVGNVTDSKKTKISSICSNDTYVVVGYQDGSIVGYQTDSEYVQYKQIFNENQGSKSLEQLEQLDNQLIVLVDGNVRMYDFPQIRFVGEVDCSHTATSFALSGLHLHCSLIESSDGSVASLYSPGSVFYLACASPKKAIQVFRWDSTSRVFCFKTEIPITQAVHSMVWFHAKTDWLQQAEAMTIPSTSYGATNTLSKFAPPVLGKETPPSSFQASSLNIGSFQLGSFPRSYENSPMFSSPYSAPASPSLTSRVIERNFLQQTPMLAISIAGKGQLFIADPATAQTTLVPLNAGKKNVSASVILCSMPFGTILAIRGTQVFLVDSKGQLVQLIHNAPSQQLKNTSPQATNRNLLSPSASPTASPLLGPSSPVKAGLEPATRYFSLDTEIYGSMLELHSAPSHAYYTHPHIVCISGSQVDVVNLYSGEPILQSIPYKQAHLLSYSTNAAYIATTHNVSVLMTIPVSTQLRAMLKKNLYENALSTVSMSLPNQWSGKMKEYIYRNYSTSLLYAFHSFALGQYDEALSAFQLCACDPRIVLSLFVQLLPTGVLANIKVPVEIPKFVSQQEFLRALSALIPYLTHMRELILRKHGAELFNEQNMALYANHEDLDIENTETEMPVPLSTEFAVIDDYDPTARMELASLTSQNNNNNNNNTTVQDAMLRKPSHLGELNSARSAAVMLSTKKVRPAADSMHVTPLDAFLDVGLLSYIDTALVMAFAFTNPSPILDFLEQPNLCRGAFLSRQLLLRDLHEEAVQLFRIRGQHTQALALLQTHAAHQHRPNTHHNNIYAYARTPQQYLDWLLHQQPYTPPQSRADGVALLLRGMEEEQLTLTLNTLDSIISTNVDDVLGAFKAVHNLSSQVEVHSVLRYPPSTALAIFKEFRARKVAMSVAISFLSDFVRAYGDLCGLIHFSSSLNEPTVKVKQLNEFVHALSANFTHYANLFSETNIINEIKALQSLHSALTLSYLGEFLGSSSFSSHKQRQEFLSFLKTSKMYNAHSLLGKLENTAFTEEYIAVLQRLKLHEQVLTMCCASGDFSAAEIYCKSVYAEDPNSGIFSKLIQMLLEKCATEEVIDNASVITNNNNSSIMKNVKANNTRKPSFNSKLQKAQVITSSSAPFKTIRNNATNPEDFLQNASNPELSAPSSDKVVLPEMTFALKLMANYPGALPADIIERIPNQISIASVEGLLKVIISNVGQRAIQTSLEKNIYKYESLRLRAEVLEESRGHVTVDSNTNCTLCSRKIGITAFARTRDNELYHYKCWLVVEEQQQK